MEGTTNARASHEALMRLGRAIRCMSPGIAQAAVVGSRRDAEAQRVRASGQGAANGQDFTGMHRPVSPAQPPCASASLREQKSSSFGRDDGSPNTRIGWAQFGIVSPNHAGSHQAALREGFRAEGAEDRGRRGSAIGRFRRSRFVPSPVREARRRIGAFVANDLSAPRPSSPRPPRDPFFLRKLRGHTTLA